MSDDFVCCADCPGIDRMWRRMQLARSILHHRPPNEDTVARALQALDGDSIEILARGESVAVRGPREAD